MPITIGPSPPSTDDLDNFDAEGDAWLAWFSGTAVPELNTLEANVEALAAQVASDAADIAVSALAAAEAAGLVAQSNTPITLSAGVKPIHFTASKPLLAELNRRVALVLKADPSIKAFGTITLTDNSDDIELTLTSGSIIGSGTYSSWEIIDAAFFATAATAAEVLQATNDVAPMTPKSLKDALQPFTLTDAATVTPSGLNGLDFEWTIGGNRTLGAITNTYRGARGEITITQDATGGRQLAWSSVYKRRGGLPVLSAAAGAIDYLSYTVKAVDGSGTATRIKVNFDKAPTS